MFVERVYDVDVVVTVVERTTGEGHLKQLAISWRIHEWTASLSCSNFSYELLNVAEIHLDSLC